MSSKLSEVHKGTGTPVVDRRKKTCIPASKWMRSPDSRLSRINLWGALSVAGGVQKAVFLTELQRNSHNLLQMGKAYDPRFSYASLLKG